MVGHVGVGLLILAILAVVVFVWLDRSAELFCLSWRQGELRLVRGRVPPALRRDLADALAHMRITGCTVVARRAEQGARLTARGVDEFAEQRLRNIFQIYPLSQLRAAKTPDHGRFVRWLGVSWLVWALNRRED